MLTPVVMTPKDLLLVNAILGIPEMALIALVSKFSIDICKTFHSSYTYLSLLISLDIYECLSLPCHVNASCTDTQGSFACQCNTGYSGTGFNCSSKYVLIC